MNITFRFDVEDFVSPEADDIAKTVADLLTEEGVPATLCVVGERARQWRERRRDDVVAAIARHDVGFHTDLHSIHPTVAEYLAECDWQDGVVEAVRREQPGLRAIREVFGVAPSCWAGAGPSWAPQIHEAMRQLGVPAVVHSPTLVPRGDVHRFCGMLTYPRGHGMPDAHYHETPVWERHLAELRGALMRDRRDGVEWTQVFLGHPSRIRYDEYWDSPNFDAGRNPQPDEWVAPRRKSDAAVETALNNVRRTVRELSALPDCEPRTIREMNALYADALDEPLSKEELSQVAPEIDLAIASMGRWPILPPSFDPGRLRALTAERLSTLRRLKHSASS